MLDCTIERKIQDEGTILRKRSHKEGLNGKCRYESKQRERRKESTWKSILVGADGEGKRPKKNKGTKGRIAGITIR